MNARQVSAIQIRTVEFRWVIGQVHDDRPIELDELPRTWPSAVRILCISPIPEHHVVAVDHLGAAAIAEQRFDVARALADDLPRVVEVEGDEAAADLDAAGAHG